MVGRLLESCSAATIADLITLLTAPALLGQPTVVDRPIVDHTGLAGYFEMVGPMPLAPTPQGGGDIDTNGSFFTVMREQLGLKFSPAREMVDVLVIDSASLSDPDSRVALNKDPHWAKQHLDEDDP